MEIRIFVDYDNLSVSHKAAGLIDVVTRALLASPLDTCDALADCEVRVYGGWYSQTTLTPRAQDVSAEIQRTFPFTIRCPTVLGPLCIVRVHGELAVALAKEPSNSLYNTFRLRQIPGDLRCGNPVSLGCTLSHCRLGGLPDLFKHQKCAEPGCSITIDKFLFRHEQKLTDTLLTCDLIYAAGFAPNIIIVVSDDDDLLPAIRTASLDNIPVLRLHPKNSPRHMSFPSIGAAITSLPL